MKKTRILLTVLCMLALVFSLFVVSASAGDGEASYGGTEYDTLAEAISVSEAGAGGTVTLLHDAVVTSTLTLTKTDIDVAGNTLTSSASTVISCTTGRKIYSSVAGGELSAEDSNLITDAANFVIGNGTQNLTVRVKRLVNTWAVDVTLAIKGSKIVSTTALSGKDDGFNVFGYAGVKTYTFTAEDTVFEFTNSIDYGGMFMIQSAAHLDATFDGCTFCGTGSTNAFSSNSSGDSRWSAHMTLNDCKVGANFSLTLGRYPKDTGSKDYVITLGENTFYNNKGIATLASGLIEAAGSDGYAYKTAQPLTDGDFKVIVDDTPNYFDTLAGAITFALDHETVVLLNKDVTLSATAALGAGTLDLNGYTLTSTASPVFTANGGTVYSSVAGGAISAESSALISGADALTVGNGTQNLTVTVKYAYSSWDVGNASLTFNGSHVVMASARTETNGAFFDNGGGSTKKPRLTVNATGTIFDFKAIDKGGVFISMNYGYFTATFTNCTLNSTNAINIYAKNTSTAQGTFTATFTGCKFYKVEFSTRYVSSGCDITLGAGCFYNAQGVAKIASGYYSAAGSDGYTYQTKAFPEEVAQASATVLVVTDAKTYYYDDVAVASGVAAVAGGIVKLTADATVTYSVSVDGFDLDLAGYTLTVNNATAFTGNSNNKIYSSAAGGKVVASNNLTADGVTLTFGNGTNNLAITAFRAYETWGTQSAALTFNGGTVSMSAAIPSSNDGFFNVGGSSSGSPVLLTVTATNTVFNLKSIDKGAFIVVLNCGKYDFTYTGCTLNADGKSMFMSTNYTGYSGFYGHVTMTGTKVSGDVELTIRNKPKYTDDYYITLGAGCSVGTPGTAALATDVVYVEGLDTGYKYNTAALADVSKVVFVSIANAATVAGKTASEVLALELTEGTDYAVAYYLKNANVTKTGLTKDGSLVGRFTGNAGTSDTVIVETFVGDGVPKFYGKIDIASGISFTISLPESCDFTFTNGARSVTFTPDAALAYKSVTVSFKVTFASTEYTLSRNYNVFQYLDAIIKNSEDADEVELAGRFASYLYYSAISFGEADAQTFFAARSFTPMENVAAPTATDTAATANIKAASVVLSATPKLAFYVSADSGNVELAYATLTGNAKKTVDLSECNVSADSGLEGYRIVELELLAFNFNTTVTVTYGTETLTYNLGDYIKGISSEADTNFALALYAYAEAAHAYVG